MENKSNFTKAVKATIYLGEIPLDVYQTNDGKYHLHIESVTSAIDEKNRDLERFIKGKSEFALDFKGSNLNSFDKVRVEGDEVIIISIPVPLATSYWHYRSKNRNKKADAIVQACMRESVERRADSAFKVQRTESDYNKIFAGNYEEVLGENREEIKNRRLPGDDLYLPVEIN
ncbi:MAG: hypothetical protein F6K54_05010 [Okeania sp. SIO3B5]|uniref:hypothetical protein n=1 Tax=Okeania sp. SIO3B5 TaxID=2607811 RepID=UPI0013FF2414|nr:hypothetical protein [Okeania sp. SIO3B5]NEO52486.1 hypothetical protein [Okeania sp. SIO3B5]